MAKTGATPEATLDTAVEQVKAEPATLTEQVRQDELATRREAAERYRELLRRNGRPTSGDTEALREVMSVLGRSLRDLDGDLELVAVLDAMDAAGRAQEELEPQLHAAVKRLGEARATYAAERDEVHDRHAELIRQAGADHRRVCSRSAAANRTINQRGRHEARWAAIMEGRVDRG